MKIDTRAALTVLLMQLMQGPWVLRAAMVCVAAGSVACSAPPKRDVGGHTDAVRDTTVVRLLALGDSYSSGEGVEPDDRWPEQLAARLRAAGRNVEEPTIIAGNGWTTTALEEKLSLVRLRVPFDLVTLMIGVNDEFGGRNTADYRASFHNLLGQARGYAGDRPGRVIVLSIPDWGATPFAAGRDGAAIAREIAAYNAINRSEAAAAGARYVDVTPSSRHAAADRTLLAEDGLHPAKKLLAEWAALVLPEVQAALSPTGQ